MLPCTSSICGSFMYMMYKITCNLMNRFYGALPVPYVPVWVTRGAVISHRYNFMLLAAVPRSLPALHCQPSLIIIITLESNVQSIKFSSV